MSAYRSFNNAWQNTGVTGDGVLNTLSPNIRKVIKFKCERFGEEEVTLNEKRQVVEKTDF